MSPAHLMSAPSLCSQICLVPTATFHSITMAGFSGCFGALCPWSHCLRFPLGLHSYIFGSLIFFFFVRKLFGQHWQGGFLFPRPAEFFLVRCGVGRCVRAHESHEVLRNLSDTETVRHPSAESPPSVCLGPEGVSPPQTPSWVGLTLPPAGHLCKARSLVHTADGGFQGLG